MLLVAGCSGSSPPPHSAPAESADSGEGHTPTERPIPFSASTNVAPPPERETLVEARQGFVTKVVPLPLPPEAAPKPPPIVFNKVSYQSSVGKLAAYLSPDPRDGKKHPAIVWITGGDCNSIGDVWTMASAKNDQSAAAYRQAGMVMMFPSLRGGNDNPGKREGFFGEVDDVLAAADFLGAQKYVDPQRIYLGGHSTGGTLVLLVAECSPRFRAVFSFGPVHNVESYPPEYLPFNKSSRKETDLRSPIYWLHAIGSPVFIFEGAQGNAEALQALSDASKNANVHCLLIPGRDHFDLLAPANKLIAKRILADTGSKTNLAFTAEDFAGPPPAK